MTKKAIVSLVIAVVICIVGSLIIFGGKQDYTMRCEKIRCISDWCPRSLYRCTNSEAVCYRYDQSTYSEAETFCFKK